MTIRLFNIEEFLLKLVLGFLSKKLLQQVMPDFKNNFDLERLGDAAGALTLLLLSTAMILASVVVILYSFLYGFSWLSITLSVIFTDAAISACYEHRNIIKQYKNKRQAL